LGPKEKEEGVDALDDAVRRQRRLSARWWAVAAVVAALCVTVSLVVLGHLSPFGRSTPAASTASPSALLTRIPIARLVQPAKLFWPSAVHELPSSLPDGSPYQVAAVLGGGRYLVTAGAAQGTGDGAVSGTGVGVFDVQAHTMRMLSSPGAAGIDRQTGYGLRYPPLVDGDLVAWAASGTTPQRVPFTEIWSAKISAGTPIRLARLSGGEVGQPHPVGDTVVWTLYDADGRTPTGIYRVPAAGGNPAKLPGTGGYDLVSGAWAQPVGQPARQQAVANDNLLNVLTRQRLKVPFGGENHSVRIVCTPQWCAGAGVERHAWAVVPADGTPGPTELDRSYTLMAGGRVAVAANTDGGGGRRGLIVWNPGTGVWAGLDSRYTMPAHATADLQVLTVPSTHGSPVEVFDLSTVAAS
jgi:hypothetical protein